SSEKTMPPAGIAFMIVMGALAPLRKNPPRAVKLPIWKWVVTSTTMAKIGTKTFRLVTQVLLLESHLMPARLMAAKTTRRASATTIPTPCKVPAPVAGSIWNQPDAHETVEKYWTVARTSTGATVAAWR